MLLGPSISISAARRAGVVPQTLVEDTFTDTNSTALTAHTPDTNEISWAWLDSVGDWDIQSNEATRSDATGGATATGDVGTSTVTEIQVDITFGQSPSQSDSFAGIAYRFQDASNVIFARYIDGLSTDGAWEISTFIGGSLTVLDSQAETITNGNTYTLRLAIDGNDLELYVDDVLKCSATTSALSSATKHGIRIGRPDETSTFDNFRLTGVPPSPSLALDAPSSYQVIQRDGVGTADISISGTYEGFPTAIEASYSGGAYSTIDASPSGGSFSGTLSGQGEGQGTLTVRFTNQTGVTASADYVGIGDVFVIAGQSNAVGQGSNNQSYSHATLKAGLFGNDYEWGELADPTDDNTDQVDAVSSDAGAGGSAWPLVATSFLSDQGVPVAFVPCATTTTSISDWQPGVDHQDRSTLYGSMVYRANQVGGVKAVLMWQGERDANLGTAEATYNSDLDAFANAVNTDLGCKVVMAKIHNTDYDETNVWNAVDTAWGDNANVLQGPDFSDITASPDSLHFTTDGEMSTAASRWWTRLSALFYP